MKRFLVPLFFLAILLAGCGGGNDNEATACANPFWNGTIGACLPTGWNVLDRAILDEQGIPQEVIAAFKRAEAVAGQFPSVTITQEVLAQPTDSTSYSAASVNSVTILPGYKQVDIREVEVDGATVSLHVFNAQPETEQPARRFYQVSAVSGTEGYTATAITPLSPERTLESEILLILENVTFTAPVVEEEGQ